MIRRMNDGDTDRIIELENKCFSRPWKYSDLDYEAHNNPYAQIYVLEEDGVIKGFYDIWVIFENSELARIAVDPDQQADQHFFQQSGRSVEYGRAERKRDEGETGRHNDAGQGDGRQVKSQSCK